MPTLRPHPVRNHPVRKHLARKHLVRKHQVRNPLVVIAHPDGDSLCMALAQAAVRGLQAGGKQVEVIDLYAEKFRPAMSCAERQVYESVQPLIEPDIVRHIELIERCDALIVVYPTWNMGLPAILKGWFDRVFLPGVAFKLDEDSQRIKGALGHVRRMVGITTYGSPSWVVRLTSDSGRRLVSRCLRMMAPTLRTRTLWCGLYGLNRPDPAAITAFIGRVEREMERL
jgi:NAD(P)H dehydrogenase (quinone)